MFFLKNGAMQAKCHTRYLSIQGNKFIHGRMKKSIDNLSFIWNVTFWGECGFQK